MVAIVIFETTEVAFERVGGFRYARIPDVAEEIRECLQQHAPCAHEVLEDPSTIGGLFDLRTEALLPGTHLRAKATSLRAGLNLRELQEDLSQVSYIGAFGVTPAPAQSLPLDMDRAPLEPDRWPDRT